MDTARCNRQSARASDAVHRRAGATWPEAATCRWSCGGAGDRLGGATDGRLNEVGSQPAAYSPTGWAKPLLEPYTSVSARSTNHMPSRQAAAPPPQPASTATE